MTAMERGMAATAGDDDLSLEARDRMARMLGHGLVQVWSRLPQDFQQEVFEAAVKSEGEEVRSQVAVFLHHRHDRTTDSLRSRSTPGSDSLGG
jgi:hypothetical protein